MEKVINKHSLGTNLNANAADSWFRLQHDTRAIEPKRALGRRDAERKALLIVPLVAKCPRLAFFGMKRYILQRPPLPKPANNILQIIRRLQIIPDHKPIRCSRTFHTIPNLLTIEINRL